MNAMLFGPAFHLLRDRDRAFSNLDRANILFFDVNDIIFFSSFLCKSIAPIHPQRWGRSRSIAAKVGDMTKRTLYRRNLLLHLQKHSAYDGLTLFKETAHDQLTSAQIAQLHNKRAIFRQLVEVSGVRLVETNIGVTSCLISRNERMQMAALTA